MTLPSRRERTSWVELDRRNPAVDDMPAIPVRRKEPGYGVTPSGGEAVHLCALFVC